MRISVHVALLTTIAVILPAAGRTALADAFSGYVPARSFELPGIDGEVREIDFLNDGRILVFRENGEVFAESEVQSGAFELLGSVSFVPSLNLNQVQVSPDGLRFAVGNFNEIAVCDLATLACTVFTAPHFFATWLDDRYLVTTQSIGAVTSILDTQSADPANPSNVSIIENIPGFAAGATLDNEGNLIVGTFDPLGQGVLMFFTHAEWNSAWKNGPVLDYQAHGTQLGVLLSAITLGFDPEGNLHVGGSESDEAFGGLVRQSAVAEAIGGAGPFAPDDPSEVRKFLAGECAIEYYLIESNPVTGDLIVRCYGESTSDVFIDGSQPVPAVSAWGGLISLMLILIAATCIYIRSPGRQPGDSVHA
ncbi:MAG: hypothetical protein ACYTHJ_08650 [Planctomycetota bacterium]|jgi:hypothetical protein